jgi:predicted nucleic acid-binding protein
LARSSDVMLRLLNSERILMHPFVIGEIALGNLKNREKLLFDLSTIPKVHIARDEDVQSLIENKKLCGLGIGYVDAHLIASTLLTKSTRFWTSDKRLAKVAEMLGLSV